VSLGPQSQARPVTPAGAPELKSFGVFSHWIPSADADGTDPLLTAHT